MKKGCSVFRSKCGSMILGCER
uniref:Uncharacterized protein n=1 Tax=Anguilla anguilla TaxID=7936 RepID=A0A0E9ST30_ANGAN